jgi:hypothetical protein
LCERGNVATTSVRVLMWGNLRQGMLLWSNP